MSLIALKINIKNIKLISGMSAASTPMMAWISKTSSTEPAVHKMLKLQISYRTNCFADVTLIDFVLVIT
jgi:hypothetical protein